MRYTHLSVSSAVDAPTAVTGLLVELLVEDAPIREVAAVARQALVCVDGVRCAPRSVHVEGLAAVAVRARGVVLAVADQLLSALAGGLDALAGVAVALAPECNSCEQ